MEADIVRSAAASTGGEAEPLIASALGSSRAGLAAGKLIDEGATALLSFGLAGALDMALATGQVVVSGIIRNEGGEALESDQRWSTAALGKLAGFGAERVDLLTSGGVIADADAKARLRAACGAGAVDMESFGIARVAEQAGIPFLAIRVILDSALQIIPPSALAGMSEGGDIAVLPVLKRVLRRPGELGPLIGLALASRKARGVLGRVAGAGLPSFGFGPFDALD